MFKNLERSGEELHTITGSVGQILRALAEVRPNIKKPPVTLHMECLDADDTVIHVEFYSKLINSVYWLTRELDFKDFLSYRQSFT